MSEPGGEVILYRSDDGQALVQLHSVGGTVWLTQAQLAELYDTSVPNIVQIIGRVLADGEVDPTTTNSELRVQLEGARTVQREVKVYNLEMILAVGYRVTTPRAVQFRQWATTVLREYLVKGFALQDERLKDPAAVDYFDELLARIREIRASEKRFYQKVREIFKATSADYASTSQTATTFFATIQNKLIYAVTGHTAGELVLKRADPLFPNMGLTTWKGARVRRTDAAISKNYLTESEVAELNRLTTMFLDFAEDRARRRQSTLMSEWVAQTDRFLSFNERSVLSGPGRVSASTVEQVIAERYAEFDERRRALEAEQSTADELQDLQELADVERRRIEREGLDDGF
jgi:hypothetical protein